MNISKNQSVIAIQGECTLDVAGGATIEHGAGRMPTAVIVTPAGPGQLVSIPPEKITENTFWAKFNWRDGSNFKPGTKIRFSAIVTVPAVEPEPPAPTVVWSSSEPLASTWLMEDVNVRNEVWNAAEAGPQTISLYSDNSWSVVSTQPKPGANEHSVKSYPCTQYLYHLPALSSFKSIVSGFRHEAPASGEWDAAYDIWIGGLGSKSTAEVMIWTDHRYPGPLPPSNTVQKATYTSPSGIVYTAWTRKNGNGGDYIALVANQKMTDGTVDILKVFQWLIGLGWLKKTDTLAAINYGIEIASTGGKPLTFRGISVVATS